MNGKKKILIIDDDESLRTVMEDKFSSEGFSVRMAKNGQEGLEIAIKERPDLILVDILMPVLDGISMIKQLREDEWGKDANIILLSNLDDTTKIAEAAQLGVFDFLTKQDYKIEDVVKKAKEKLFFS